MVKFHMAFLKRLPTIRTIPVFSSDLCSIVSRDAFHRFFQQLLYGLYSDAYAKFIKNEGLSLCFRFIHYARCDTDSLPHIEQLNNYLYSGHSALIGKSVRMWQEKDYILKLFHNRLFTVRRRYREFVEKGSAQGRRPELAGGGLVRSVGGWKAVKSLRESGFLQKSDERILGDGDFVTAVLEQAHEQYEKRYQLKASGYDIKAVVEWVSKLLDMNPAQVVTASKNRRAIEARSLVCYWAHRALGISQNELAKKFGISQPAGSSAVNKGEKLVREAGYKLIGSNIL